MYLINGSLRYKTYKYIYNLETYTKMANTKYVQSRYSITTLFQNNEKILEAIERWLKRSTL